MLDSVWGTVPIGADTFSMIGGDLVAKLEQKMCFQLKFGTFGLVSTGFWPRYRCFGRVKVGSCWVSFVFSLLGVAAGVDTVFGCLL